MEKNGRIQLYVKKNAAGKPGRLEEMPLSLKRMLGMQWGGLQLNGRKSWLVGILVFLAVLVLLSAVVYYVRVGRVEIGESPGAGNQHPSVRVNRDLGPPGNVKVVVDKGATITWDPVEDIRVVGYNIYRYKGEGDPGSKVNAAIVSDTVYHDDEGTMFNSYAVAPVDNQGREGALSPPVPAEENPKTIAELTPAQPPVKVKDATFKGQPKPVGLSPSTLDCTADGMTYMGTWYLERYPEVTGGTIMVTPYGGDYFTYTFAGDGVAVIASRHRNYGIMQVYVDGELRQEVDLYSPQTQVAQKVFSISGLGPGAHTIKVVCTGRRNPAAYFTFVGLEALEIVSSP